MVKFGKMKTVTLGIPTYCCVKFVANCLSSIQKSIFDAKYKDYIDVLVVDDGSPEIEGRLIKDLCLRFNVRYLRNEQNQGFTDVANKIVKESEGDIVVLINNDVVIPDRWFWSIYYFLTANDCGVASYLSQKVTLEEADALLEKTRIPAVGSGRVPERATELAGYAYGFTRENYNRVKGFDEKFKMFISDSDFCVKMAKIGLTSYRILYPIIYHLEHATFEEFPDLFPHKTLASRDIAMFKKKWGCSPKEMEAQMLKELEPNKVRWYSNYSYHEAWDVEGLDSSFTPFVRHVDLGNLTFETEHRPGEVMGAEELQKRIELNYCPKCGSKLVEKKCPKGCI